MLATAAIVAAGFALLATARIDGRHTGVASEPTGALALIAALAALLTVEAITQIRSSA